MEAHEENIIVVHCKGGKGEGWESGRVEGWKSGGCEGLLWGTLKRLNCATSKVCLKVDGKFGSPYQETFTSNIALIQSKY